MRAFESPQGHHPLRINSGRSAAVARLVWDQEVASSILAAPTIKLIEGMYMPSDRPNWYYDHPPTCTCVSCTDVRLNKDRGDGWLAKIKKLASSIFGKHR